MDIREKMDVLYKRDGYREYKCCRYKREDDMWCCVCIRAMNCTYKREDNCPSGYKRNRGDIRGAYIREKIAHIRGAYIREKIAHIRGVDVKVRGRKKRWAYIRE